jgi:hypothetical protein
MKHFLMCLKIPSSLGCILQYAKLAFGIMLISCHSSYNRMRIITWLKILSMSIVIFLDKACFNDPQLIWWWDWSPESPHKIPALKLVQLAPKLFPRWDWRLRYINSWHPAQIWDRNHAQAAYIVMRIPDQCQSMALWFWCSPGNAWHPCSNQIYCSAMKFAQMGS